MEARKLIAVFGVVVLSFAAMWASQLKPAPGFEQLKTLVGEWEGKAENGKAVRASYRLVSAGTALLETLDSPDESEMVTVYTADGDRVAVTHYCSANNQPRMQTAPITGPATRLAFSFVGATDLASPDAGHMHKLEVSIEDANHFTQKWTWLERGKEVTEVFRFTRKK